LRIASEKSDKLKIPLAPHFGQKARLRWILFVFIGILLVSKPIGAVESVFPDGYNIEIQYQIYPPDFNYGDSITITWTVHNLEHFQLRGLYFSDCIPGGLDVALPDIMLEDRHIQFEIDGPAEIEFPEYPGQVFSNYRWIIDSPADEGGISNIVGNNELLVFRYTIVNLDSTEHILPFHTTCFFGNETGYFTTAEPIIIPPVSTDVPTLGTWGMIILGLLVMAISSVFAIGRNRKVPVTKSFYKL